MAHPLHLPYAQVFASYPTRTLEPGTRLEAGRTGKALLAGREHPLLYAGLDQILDPDVIRKTVFLARNGETAAQITLRLIELCPGLAPDRAAFHILWAVKHDLLQTAEEA